MDIQLEAKIRAKLEAEHPVDVEIWVTVAGCSAYEVSNFGFVRGKVLQTINKVCNNGERYPSVYMLPDNEKYRRSFALHRVVAQAFIPNPYNKPMVNHINGNKKDYSVSNLEWVTCQENAKHAYATGLNCVPCLKGQDHAMAKLKERDVINILKMYYLINIEPKVIARAYDVDYSLIHLITTGKNWKDTFEQFLTEYRKRFQPAYRKQKGVVI